jgi:hypothetical protein
MQVARRNGSNSGREVLVGFLLYLSLPVEFAYVGAVSGCYNSDNVRQDVETTEL